MLRWTVACAILFFCTARLAANELAVFVNDEDHFVLSSDGIELLGVQLESASGSLIPDLTGDTGPFQLQMQNDSNIVMFGSLGAGVQVDGSMILPTRWNPTGMRDVGFRWGSPDDDGFGAVAGHSPETVSPARPTVVPDEPNEPIRQQDVAAAIVVESTDSADADKFPGILTLYPQPNDGHLELHVYDDPTESTSYHLPGPAVRISLTWV